MIKITKLNKDVITVNADLIESIEANPDTALILTSGKRIVVRDSVDEIVERVLKYKKFIHASITVRKS